jgi:hypothetical protein
MININKTKLTNLERATIRKAMKAAHKLGLDISLMAKCSESYQIALKIKLS